VGAARRFVLAHRTVVAIAVAAILVVVVARVQSDSEQGPKPVSGTPKEAVAVVEAFQGALASRDFATICDGLFTPRARKAAGGDNCQSVLAQATSELRGPQVRITSVALLRSGHATVTVLAGVAGHRWAVDTIRLVRQHGRFRIASAGAPAPGG
jgi:hypothetical protein